MTDTDKVSIFKFTLAAPTLKIKIFNVAPYHLSGDFHESEQF